MTRVAMISGASRGIGAAIALRLQAQGWQVSLGLRRPEEAPVFGPEVLACRYDALDPASEQQWMKETIARFGRLDGLVLNAGIHSSATVLEAGGDEFDRLMDVNVKSPLRLAQLAWPHLGETGSEKLQAGRIVLMSSLSGKRVKSAGSGLYGISKFALMGLAHGLRQCGRDNRIRTTAICPSFVATDMASSLAADSTALTQPEDIACIVAMVLELPSTASIADIPVHWTVEDCY
ncbi:SDR family NAD(P)-dependent oxidoreductase [Paracoccus sp. SY]|uniref:SDR family NAD(P)-dependent oxidoreductase n=1 Tax=Paracoccus sp. SY TaxID=1330255 RepID=UPI000CD0DBF7|nr:SDR family NAD(P)-dependent oxidoreductase [Paracoccus sp. SY]